jgi:hypothetical protein
MSDVGPRQGRVGSRVSARHGDAFNQDNETLRDSGQPGWLRPPDRPRLT